MTFDPHTFSPMQIEHLKRQDTSAQLREAKDHLSTSQSEERRLRGELEDSKKREELAKAQMSHVEQQWKQRLEQVSKILLG